MSKHQEKSHSPTKGSAADQTAYASASAEAAQGADPAGAEPKGSEACCEAEATASAAIEAELKARIASLEAENSNLKDQYLRKAAEFENFRKRMMKDKQDAIEFANQSLLMDIIPVIDDFERAIKASEASGDFSSFRDGIVLIEKRLVSQLESKWGLVRFESAGTAFDPNRHEAIMMEKSPEVSEATVSEDFMRGYTLKDRVVRAAKVKVLMPSEEGSAASADAAGTDAATTDGKN
jgi:molecular chaperone GrpE